MFNLEICQVQFGFAARQQGYSRTRSGKAKRQSFPDTSAGAGNENAFAFYISQSGQGAASRLSGGWYFEGDHSQHAHSPTPPGRYVAIPGMSVTTGGETRAEDLTLAARNAVLGMIDYLARKGWTEQEAYAITSVAVDLKVSELVDVPSYVVTAFLPLGIFADGRAERP